MTSGELMDVVGEMVLATGVCCALCTCATTLPGDDDMVRCCIAPERPRYPDDFCSWFQPDEEEVPDGDDE